MIAVCTQCCCSVQEAGGLQCSMKGLEESLAHVRRPQKLVVISAKDSGEEERGRVKQHSFFSTNALHSESLPEGIAHPVGGFTLHSSFQVMSL